MTIYSFVERTPLLPGQERQPGTGRLGRPSSNKGLPFLPPLALRPTPRLPFRSSPLAPSLCCPIGYMGRDTLEEGESSGDDSTGTICTSISGGGEMRNLLIL